MEDPITSMGDQDPSWSDTESLGTFYSCTSTSDTHLTDVSSTPRKSCFGHDRSRQDEDEDEDEDKDKDEIVFPSSRTLHADSAAASYFWTPASSLSLDAPYKEEDNEDQICFPSYDDVGYYDQVKDLEPPVSPCTGDSYIVSPTSNSTSTGVLRPESPGPIEHTEDDTAVRTQPSRHVDYLSHNWKEEDIWLSWKHIVSKRKAYNNSVRLENALWRIWTKSKNKLKTVSPETLNWLKDCDVTWLYGLLQTRSDRSLMPSTSPASNSRISKSNSFLQKKPILKKRSMSEIILQRSLSSSSLLKQAAAAVQAQQSENGRTERPGMERDRSDHLAYNTFSSRSLSLENTSTLSSILSSGLRSPKSGEKKHIHFNEQVEQCIALEMKWKDDEEPDDALYDSDGSDSDDRGIMMKRSNSKRKLSIINKRKTPRQSFSVESKTIAMLPSTTLKYRADTPEPPETAIKHSSNGFWNGSKLSPSPSQETLRPWKPSTRLLLGDDEEDDPDIDWQPLSWFANRKDSVTFARDRFQNIHISGSSSQANASTPSETQMVSSNPFFVSITSKRIPATIDDRTTEQEKDVSTLKLDYTDKSIMKNHVERSDVFLDDEGNMSLSEHDSKETKRDDGATTKKEASGTAEGCDTGAESETNGSQLPPSHLSLIYSGDSLNVVDEDVDDTTTESYSGESDETGSSNSFHSEVCDLIKEGAYDVEEVVVSTMDPMRQALVDRVMEEFWIIFNQNWDTGVREYAGEASSSSTSRDGNGNLTSEYFSPFSPRKRRKADDERRNDESGKDSRGPDGSVGPTRGLEESTRLACPFRKHDSRRYGVYSHPICALSHWETIARVKEHLYRGHRKAPYCKRCWITFKNQEQLDAHLIVAASDICDVQPGRPPEGITLDHERVLRSRKKTSPNQSNADRWRDIYKLLFPNEEIPSPYFEPLQEEASMSPNSRDLSNYESYIRRELPRVVRSNIEDAVRREMQPFEASLISNLVSIIQDSQERVFRSYRETQGVGEENETLLSIDCEALESRSSANLENGEGRNSRPLDFIDTMFAPPIQTSTSTFSPRPEIHNSFNILPRVSSNTVPSDSGYSSDHLQLCGCPGSGPCHCGTSTLLSHPENELLELLDDDTCNGWTACPSLDQLNSMSRDIDWSDS